MSLRTPYYCCFSSPRAITSHVFRNPGHGLPRCDPVQRLVREGESLPTVGADMSQQSTWKTLIVCPATRPSLDTTLLLFAPEMNRPKSKATRDGKSRRVSSTEHKIWRLSEYIFQNFMQEEASYRKTSQPHCNYRKLRSMWTPPEEKPQ